MNKTVKLVILIISLFSPLSLPVLQLSETIHFINANL